MRFNAKTGDDASILPAAIDLKKEKIKKIKAKLKSLNIAYSVIKTKVIDGQEYIEIDAETDAVSKEAIAKVINPARV